MKNNHRLNPVREELSLLKFTVLFTNVVGSVDTQHNAQGNAFPYVFHSNNLVKGLVDYGDQVRNAFKQAPLRTLVDSTKVQKVKRLRSLHFDEFGCVPTK